MIQRQASIPNAVVLMGMPVGNMSSTKTARLAEKTLKLAIGIGCYQVCSQLLQMVMYADSAQAPNKAMMVFGLFAGLAIPCCGVAGIKNRSRDLMAMFCGCSALSACCGCCSIFTMLITASASQNEAFRAGMHCAEDYTCPSPDCISVTADGLHGGGGCMTCPDALAAGKDWASLGANGYTPDCNTYTTSVTSSGVTVTTGVLNQCALTDCTVFTNFYYTAAMLIPIAIAYAFAFKYGNELYSDRTWTMTTTQLPVSTQAYMQQPQYAQPVAQAGGYAPPQVAQVVQEKDTYAA